MPATIERAMTQRQPRQGAFVPPRKGSRWLWFVGLWLAGTVTLLVVAFLLRALMSAVGMSS